jgi:hypothetical protein
VACCSSKTSTDPTATCNFLPQDQICYELWTVDEDISWEGGTFFLALAPTMEKTGFSSTTPRHYSLHHQHCGRLLGRENGRQKCNATSESYKAQKKKNYVLTYRFNKLAERKNLTTSPAAIHSIKMIDS